MTKFAARIIGMLLVPCLLADPSFAMLLSHSFGAPRGEAAAITQQALQTHLTTPFFSEHHPAVQWKIPRLAAAMSPVSSGLFGWAMKKGWFRTSVIGTAIFESVTIMVLGHHFGLSLVAQTAIFVLWHLIGGRTLFQWDENRELVVTKATSGDYVLLGGLSLVFHNLAPWSIQHLLLMLGFWSLPAGPIILTVVAILAHIFWNLYLARWMGMPLAMALSNDKKIVIAEKAVQFIVAAFRKDSSLRRLMKHVNIAKGIRPQVPRQAITESMPLAKPTLRQLAKKEKLRSLTIALGAETRTDAQYCAMAASFVLKRYRTKAKDVSFPTNEKIGEEIGRKGSYVSVQLPAILDILEKAAAMMKKKGDSRLSDAIVIERMRRKSPYDRLFQYLLKYFEGNKTTKKAPTYRTMAADAHVDRDAIAGLWPQVKRTVEQLALKKPQQYARFLWAVNHKENEREEAISAIAESLVNLFRQNTQRLVFPGVRVILELNPSYKRTYISALMPEVAKYVLKMKGPKNDADLTRAKEAAAAYGKEKEFLIGKVVDHLVAVLLENPEQDFYPDPNELAQVIHVHFVTIKEWFPDINSALKSRVGNSKSKKIRSLSNRLAAMVPFDGRRKNKKGGALPESSSSAQRPSKPPKQEIPKVPANGSSNGHSNGHPKTPQASAVVSAPAPIYEFPASVMEIVDLAISRIDQIETAMDRLCAHVRVNEIAREMMATHLRDIMTASSTDEARFALEPILELEHPIAVALGLEALDRLLEFNKDSPADFNLAMFYLRKTGQDITSRLERISSSKLWTPQTPPHIHAQYLGAA